MSKLKPMMARPTRPAPQVVTGDDHEEAIERFARGAPDVADIASMTSDPPAKAPGKPGRPAKDDKGAQLVVRVPTPLLAEVDTVIAGRLDAPNRSVVVREALVLWLARNRAG